MIIQFFFVNLGISAINHQTMIYPSVGQYTEAIKLAEQSPEDYFATMTTLRPVLGADGNPVMSSGNFAVVFKMQDQINSKEYALPFSADGRKLFKIGVSFSSETRRVAEWKTEKYIRCRREKITRKCQLFYCFSEIFIIYLQRQSTEDNFGDGKKQKSYQNESTKTTIARLNLMHYGLQRRRRQQQY